MEGLKEFEIGKENHQSMLYENYKLKSEKSLSVNGLVKNQETSFINFGNYLNLMSYLLLKLHICHWLKWSTMWFEDGNLMIDFWLTATLFCLIFPGAMS